ncbi:MAG: ABC transporter ATP-binding protein [Methylobacterium mesophilicum]|nr:ABC transporter ATP-binding protein [Methylobacterium mesophilicum]
MTGPLLALADLTKRFKRGHETLAAVEGISLTVAPGETLALVGPSGSGKSTLARLVLRLLEPDAGTIRFEGEDWLALSGNTLRQKRARMQAVFQDPLAAFNPRATVKSALADPLRIHGLAPRAQRRERIADLLHRVGLDPALASRAIHEISGGQRQRVAIARALASHPRLVVLDEATSALDVSVRGQVLDLLARLQAEEGLSYLFISHDLAVVHRFAHRVAVMDRGRIVETGPVEAVVNAPQSETARALLAAAPRLNRKALA